MSKVAAYGIQKGSPRRAVLEQEMHMNRVTLMACIVQGPIFREGTEREYQRLRFIGSRRGVQDEQSHSKRCACMKACPIILCEDSAIQRTPQAQHCVQQFKTSRQSSLSTLYDECFTSYNAFCKTMLRGPTTFCGKEIQKKIFIGTILFLKWLQTCNVTPLCNKCCSQ